MTKKEIKNKCNKIMYKYDLGQKITNKDEFLFVYNVLNKHPHFNLKKGVGVESITTIIPDGRYRCFYINRFDGTGTDISLNKCLKPFNKEDYVKKACRSAVQSEIDLFRSSINFGNDRCPITNEILTENNTEVDHYNLTFNDMYLLWIKDKCIDSLYNDCYTNEDNKTNIHFNNMKIIEDFVKFHNNNTNLRAVSIEANRSILKKKETIN